MANEEISMASSRIWQGLLLCSISAGVMVLEGCESEAESAEAASRLMGRGGELADLGRTVEISGTIMRTEGQRTMPAPGAAVSLWTAKVRPGVDVSTADEAALVPDELVCQTVAGKTGEFSFPSVPSRYYILTGAEVSSGHEYHVVKSGAGSYGVELILD